TTLSTPCPRSLSRKAKPSKYTNRCSRIPPTRLILRFLLQYPVPCWKLRQKKTTPLTSALSSQSLVRRVSPPALPTLLRRKMPQLKSQLQKRKSPLLRRLHQLHLATLLMSRCQSSVSLSLKAPSPSG